MTEKNEEPSLDHLKWLIEARGKNNHTALDLLSLFEAYPKQIRKIAYSSIAEELVAIAFSLWRAAFLADRKGKSDLRVGAAESFLRKILVDNQIGFAQDRLWREWAFNYYINDALSRLQILEGEMDINFGELSPIKGKRTSKNRWNILHGAFKKAVKRLGDDLEDADNAK